jgi:hypothetical protein
MYTPVFTRGAVEGETYDHLQKITNLRKAALSSKFPELREQAVRDRIRLVRERSQSGINKGPLTKYHTDCKVIERLFKKKNPKKYVSIVKKIEKERKIKLKFKKMVPTVIASAPKKKKNLPF